MFHHPFPENSPALSDEAPHVRLQKVTALAIHLGSQSLRPDLRLPAPEVARQRLRWIPGLLLEDADRITKADWRQRINTCDPLAAFIKNKSSLTSISIIATQYTTKRRADMERYLVYPSNEVRPKTGWYNEMDIRLQYYNPETHATAQQNVLINSDSGLGDHLAIARQVDGTACTDNGHHGHRISSYYGDPGELMDAMEFIVSHGSERPAPH